MLDIRNLSNPYKFADGPKVVTCKNPSVQTFNEFRSSQGWEAIQSLFKEILYDEDKHYAEEISPIDQATILEDYFTYHTSQLGERFRSAVNPEE